MPTTPPGPGPAFLDPDADGVPDLQGRRHPRLPELERGRELCFRIAERIHGTVVLPARPDGTHRTFASRRLGTDVFFNVPGPSAGDVPTAVSALLDACLYKIVCTDLRGREHPPFTVLDLPPHAGNAAMPGAIAFRVRAQMGAGDVHAPRTGRLAVRHGGRRLIALDLRRHRPART